MRQKSFSSGNNDYLSEKSLESSSSSEFNHNCLNPLNEILEEKKDSNIGRSNFDTQSNGDRSALKIALKNPNYSLTKTKPFLKVMGKRSKTSMNRNIDSQGAHTYQNIMKKEISLIEKQEDKMDQQNRQTGFVYKSLCNSSALKFINKRNSTNGTRYRECQVQRSMIIKTKKTKKIQNKSRFGCCFNTRSTPKFITTDNNFFKNSNETKKKRKINILIEQAGLEKSDNELKSKKSKSKESILNKKIIAKMRSKNLNEIQAKVISNLIGMNQTSKKLLNNSALQSQNKNQTALQQFAIYSQINMDGLKKLKKHISKRIQIEVKKVVDSKLPAKSTNNIS